MRTRAHLAHKGRSFLVGLLTAMAASVVIVSVPSATARAGHEYRIVGIPPADALLVREGPLGADPTRARALTRIPANAAGILGTGVTQQFGAFRWIEIVFDGQTGWVNGRYLQAATGNVSEELGLDFTCRSATPDWSLSLSRDAAVFRSTSPRGGEQRVVFTIMRREPAPGRTDVQHLALEPTAGVAMTAQLRSISWCRLSGAELDYGFEIRLLGAPGLDQPQAGCCRLKR